MHPQAGIARDTQAAMPRAPRGMKEWGNFAKTFHNSCYPTAPFAPPSAALVKLSPHPHAAAALGFLNEKAAVRPSSRQSMTVPTTCMRAPGSINTVTPGAAWTSSSHLALVSGWEEKKEMEEGREEKSGENERERGPRPRARAWRLAPGESEKG